MPYPGWVHIHTYTIFLFIHQVVQVFPGAVPQHRRLLHQPPHGEEDLHPVHGGDQCHLHPNVRVWDDLPCGQAHSKSLQCPTLQPEAPVRRDTPDQEPGPAQIANAPQRPLLSKQRVQKDGQSQRGYNNPIEEAQNILLHWRTVQL